MSSQGQGKRQIATSFATVSNSIRDTTAQLIQIRQKNQKLQKESRLFDDKRSKQRYASIQQEAILSNKKNTALQMKWSELKEEEECQKLFQAIQEQKNAFKGIIDGKQRLIKQFWDELKKKDDDYVKMMKEQSTDIKQLVNKMRNQFFTLRDQNLHQLEQIQRKFEAQRRSYIDEAMNKVDACFKKHIDMEQSFAQNKKKAQEDFTKKIQDLRVQGAKTYADMKIRMETQIQNLQKCYEQMKALYLLNTEKLDYNLKVLREKKQQNAHLMSQHTKRQRILNNKLRALRDEYQKADRIFKDQNKMLTQQYKRITRQFKQLQRKFKHFQKADLDRYNQIQIMNEADVEKLKNKILKCDMTIHIQQLGMDWQKPQQQKIDQKSKSNSVAPINEGNGESETRLVVSEKKLQEMLTILVDEADFIFDDKMREQLERANLEEKLNQKVDLLKKTLSIDSIDELNIFLQEMANQCKWVSERQKQILLEEKLKREQQAREQQQRQLKKLKRKGQEKKLEQKKEEKLVQPQPRVDLNSDFKLDPTLVVDFMIWWMNTKEQRKKLLEKTAKKSIKQLSERQKKEHIAREGKKYWLQLTQVLPERKFRIWSVLDKGLSKYYDLLLARQKLIDQTGELHNQNEELKNLLNQYLQINHQLLIPPTRLMEKEG